MKRMPTEQKIARYSSGSPSKAGQYFKCHYEIRICEIRQRFLLLKSSSQNNLRSYVLIVFNDDRPTVRNLDGRSVGRLSKQAGQIHNRWTIE